MALSMRYQVSDTVDEGFINVVVRCRGCNAAEIRENSRSVVTTEGTSGKALQVLMGPQDSKTYQFDRVFSPDASQDTIFDHVVKPLLNEMNDGFTCTVLAYGQTGTGKTYTMTGETAMTEDADQNMDVLSGQAGIIPRVLVDLFSNLGSTEIKVSFIELYNEELRDLISLDETARIKIYNKKFQMGSTPAIVQGIEERHILSAEEGINILRDGILKRQVAAFKHNELSSRSHTVFTITTYTPGIGESGDKVWMRPGKLNLVNLAGSENIQRSEAKNKHAIEAGLIDKNLLALWRVVNALAARKKPLHIPYRESKLTQLLQNSLGGNTRTSVIATISPANSSIEETLSTLNFAVRAKAIQNYPQLNRLILRYEFLKELVAGYVRANRDAARRKQIDTVSLKKGAHTKMPKTMRAQKSMIVEQTFQVTTLQSSVDRRAPSLRDWTISLLESQNELEDSRLRLEKLGAILAESRAAHLEDEERWAEHAKALTAVIYASQNHIEGLYDKEQRMVDLEDLRCLGWESAQLEITHVSLLIEQITSGLCQQQFQRISSMSKRIRSFLDLASAESAKMQDSIRKQVDALHNIRDYLAAQVPSTNLDQSLEDIKGLCTIALERLLLLLQSTMMDVQAFAAGVVSDLKRLHQEIQEISASL